MQGPVRVYDTAMSPFDWTPVGPTERFVDAGQPIDDPLYLVLAVLMALALVGGIVTRLTARGRFDGHRFKQRLAVGAATYASWLAAAGLVILLFRWQAVPLLSKPIWWYLWVLTAVGLIAYAAYYYYRLYPPRLLAYDESARRKRYLPRRSPNGGHARQRQRRAR